VTGGQISVNGGGYTTSTTISVGQSFTVQVTSSSSNSTAATATVTAGGVSANFVVTTLAATV
jgi:threonine/homoserine/homoserine lactone efflux protein